MSEIEGLNELLGKLDRLPANIERNITRGMIYNGANMIRDELKAAAPVLQPGTVNPHDRRAGQLRDGIVATMVHAPRGQVIGGVRIRIKADILKALKSAKRKLQRGNDKGVSQASAALESVAYWTAVEYGHSSKARPFIRSTWDRSKMKLVSFMTEYARRRLEKVAHD
jgi:HK97 gp10 family phage protein